MGDSDSLFLFADDYLCLPSLDSLAWSDDISDFISEVVCGMGFSISGSPIGFLGRLSEFVNLRDSVVIQARDVDFRSAGIVGSDLLMYFICITGVIFYLDINGLSGVRRSQI